MNKRPVSKDELFLLKLYEFAMKYGSYGHPIDRFTIGRAIGQNDKGINTIVKHLAQANFVIKEDPKIVRLTAHGLKLVEHLQKEI